MSGLFLLVLFAAWAALVVAIVWFALRRSSALTKTATSVVAVILTLAALFADEVRAARVFGELCAARAVVRVTGAPGPSKTVYLRTPVATEVLPAPVRINAQKWSFVTLEQGTSVLEYETLSAAGGIVARSIGLSESAVPLTFIGSCAPKNAPASLQTFMPYGLLYVEPPGSAKAARRNPSGQ